MTRQVPATSMAPNKRAAGVPVKSDVRPVALPKLTVPVADDLFKAVRNKGSRGPLALEVVTAWPALVASATAYVLPRTPDGHIVLPLFPSMETLVATACRPF